jgi:hypothetical protein
LKKGKTEGKKTPSIWNLLSSLPLSPHKPTTPPAQAPEWAPASPPPPSTSCPFPSLQRLQRELEQCHNQDIENLPFPQSEEEKPHSLFLLREVPFRGGDIGFINALLTSPEVQNFKKELRPLLEDPFGVSEQVDQFLGPQIYTWAELMSIFGILLSGEEKALTCRAAIAIWESEHPPDKMSWWLMLSLLIKIPDGITAPHSTEKI